MVKKTFNSLSIFSELNSKDQETTRSLLSSLENIAKSIWTFRNTHGYFSHWQDIESKKFDKYLTSLVIESSDLLSSFLLVSHLESLVDRHRIFYEEYEVFNSWMDENEEWLEVRWVPCSPSFTLFNSDIEAYKAAYIDFSNDPDALINSLELQEDQEEKSESLVSSIIKIKNIFSTDQLEELNRVIQENQNINKRLVEQLNQSWIFDVIKKVQDDMWKISDNINETLNPTKTMMETISDITK